MTTCSDCGQDHGHQRVDYPVGAVVVALVTISDITGGSKGKVVDHCDDGRAVVKFEGSKLHTFHHPGGFIALDEAAQLRADLARVTAERDQLRAALASVAQLRDTLEVLLDGAMSSRDDITNDRDRLRAALEPFAKVADIINYPVHDPGSMYIWSRNSNKPGETYGVTLADCQRARAALDSTKEQ